ncbi:coiled-coil domain-containing protein 130 homolog [Daktulosphaira vitifoliae]|uniref:coiled-coil domain-containing protein 130 homolog n=1 Tax=Daktulosphaira vitifoliae TaxID=58002 RepID=UPI0021AAE381|nr:coiled-coil domain-containing protein 130 homolog [Daktulosphaira vitifoliae]XP_050548844.1 coiled-coil domain-containing protein 130 homolog [Daktulosphaira vitifoliae]XP_050548845.1 coiled-coil domain-containing protein 130 homolog [Daktulosphaira vitifoliae]
MGERKGTNKYYPPDYNPAVGGLNKFRGTHALRERARKLHMGILIIRFEMPYNIWCEGCNNHIGMGVRYNAEKKKIGMYYSTPVYQFRMKCHLCDNHFEIKTDPGNLDYVIVSGARRQENRWDPTENEQIVPEDKDTSKRLFDDAMFKLEHGTEDLDKAKKAAPVLVKLHDKQDSKWNDDFAANSLLRQQFRTKKQKIAAKEKLDNNLKERLSLSIPLVDESDEDAKIAKLLSFQTSESTASKQKQFIKGLRKSSKVTPKKSNKNLNLRIIQSTTKVQKENSSSSTSSTVTKSILAPSLVSVDYESLSE